MPHQIPAVFPLHVDARSPLTSSFASSISGPLEVASGLHLVGTCSEGFCCTLICHLWGLRKLGMGAITLLNYCGREMFPNKMRKST